MRKRSTKRINIAMSLWSSFFKIPKQLSPTIEVIPQQLDKEVKELLANYFSPYLQEMPDAARDAFIAAICDAMHTDGHGEWLQAGSEIEKDYGILKRLFRTVSHHVGLDKQPWRELPEEQFSLEQHCLIKLEDTILTFAPQIAEKQTERVFQNARLTR